MVLSQVSTNSVWSLSDLQLCFFTIFVSNLLCGRLSVVGISKEIFYLWLDGNCGSTKLLSEWALMFAFVDLVIREGIQTLQWRVLNFHVNLRVEKLCNSSLFKWMILWVFWNLGAAVAPSHHPLSPSLPLIANSLHALIYTFSGGVMILLEFLLS